jgi:hypothetical protein
MRLRRVPAAILVCAIAAAPLAAQSPCPDHPPLPAYAHNDYENPSPLHDALRLGYAGVEADVVLVRGTLVVAHERRSARAGRTLEALYLRPLREVMQRCGGVLSSNHRFLLNIELKERSRSAYDSLVALLGRYGDLVGGAGFAGSLDVVLVGWHPPAKELDRAIFPVAGIQRKIARLDARAEEDAGGLVRLVSLDYGKTIGRDLSRRDEWLAALRRAKGEGQGRIARVYDVPVRHEVYSLLLAAGVDLIGTEDLEGTRRELAQIGEP